MYTELKNFTVIDKSLIEHDTNVFQEISSMARNSSSPLWFITGKEGRREREGEREKERDRRTEREKERERRRERRRKGVRK